MNDTMMKKMLPLTGLVACMPVLAANVLVNPTFEAPNNTTGWVGFGGTPAIAASTEQVHGGTQAALVSGRSATTVGIAQTVTSLLQAGRGHDVRVWVRNRQAVSAAYSLGIKLVDGAGTNYIVLDNRTVPAGKWVKLGGYYKHSPTGTVSLAQLYLNGPAVGVDFFIDDARLDPPEAYTPPASVASDFIRASGRRWWSGPTTRRSACSAPTSSPTATRATWSTRSSRAATTTGKTTPPCAPPASTWCA
jgi:hypothetical protein